MAGLFSAAYRLTAGAVKGLVNLFQQQILRKSAESAKESTEKIAQKLEQAPKKLINVDEAFQILGIKKDTFDPAKLDETFARMFNANDPSNGGSFYLQSKIFRAKESIDAKLEAERSLKARIRSKKRPLPVPNPLAPAPRPREKPS